MAINKIFDRADVLSVVCTHPTTPTSGSPVRFGQRVGVALTDERTDGTTTVQFRGVFDLSAKGINDSGNSAIAVGDALFYIDGDTPVINKKSSGYFVGTALEGVGSGSTGTIQVALQDSPGSGTLGTGTVSITNLAADAVDGTKIADDAIDSEHIAAGAIDTEHYADESVTSAKVDPTLIQSSVTNLTSAQIKALKATPITLAAAPGADLALVPIAVHIVVNYGGTNAFTESADDLSICYATTPGSNEIKEIESTGFIDQTNDEWRYITFEHAETFIPVENDAIVITNLDDEIAGNAADNNTARVVLYYRVVPTDL